MPPLLHRRRPGAPKRRLRAPQGDKAQRQPPVRPTTRRVGALRAEPLLRPAHRLLRRKQSSSPTRLRRTPPTPALPAVRTPVPCRPVSRRPARPHRYRLRRLSRPLLRACLSRLPARRLTRRPKRRRRHSHRNPGLRRTSLMSTITAATTAEARVIAMIIHAATKAPLSLSPENRPNRPQAHRRLCRGRRNPRTSPKAGSRMRRRGDTRAVTATGTITVGTNRRGGLQEL
jgi:hypothetical protein